VAKDSDRLRGGFDIGETGGALSGLLAEEDEFDRRALWRLGTWAAVAVGAVIVALITNQSSIGMRREQTASADLLKQAQQLQLTSKEGQNETRRLASAIDTLNSDRDRLYSRVAVLEQGLDSVTGAIARQGSASSSPQAGASQSTPGQPTAGQPGANQGSANQAGLSQVNASQGNSAQSSIGVAAPSSPSANPPAQTPSAVAVPTALVAPVVASSAEPPTAAAKPSPAPIVGPVAATAPAVTEKQDKQAVAATPAEPNPAAKSTSAPQAASAQPSGSLMASKSMMAPPDPAAGKLIESPMPPKLANTAPMPEVTAAAPTAAAETEAAPVSAVPELTVQHTEFGVDVGGANSIPGLRALWHGLLKSKANAALTKLRPIIVIKESTNGLGMQLRLVAGPISDAAAAAKICASLTVSDRSCWTTVFEGQRLAVNADEADKTEASKSEAEADSKPGPAPSKPSGHKHTSYSGKRPKTEDTPKSEPSTLSLIFGRR
jgi:hypothetical protein